MNRLAEATSPYLLQHAGNPVDWYEWGEEALERARREDRPILLSVGYAACHWCHVMERESFEDEATARLMNERFVCVKVDREERPDIDAIYMDAVQAMTGHGGWPMTVFLTPDLEPFYAGTYFPPEDRHGMPGFRSVLAAVAAGWDGERERILTQGRRVTEAISRSLPASRDPIEEDVLEEAGRALESSFDRQWGGFGPAPKFPQPMNLDLLLRLRHRGAAHAERPLTHTLDRMAAGGIHDHVGGGFHRYSTDERWLVPHFEKMLYDNAQLARTYLHAFQAFPERAHYREVSVRTLEYLLRDLRHPEGGFFSSEDADSEGEEGTFYVWSWEEFTRVAGEGAARSLGASPEGNWEDANVLTLDLDGPVPEEARAALPALFEARERRTRPATDDKVLAAWNGLAIQAFAEAGRVLDEPRYVEAARAAGAFVLDRMQGGDGRLLRAWRQGRTSGPGYSDDYACMAAACLTLYETTFEIRWFEEARRLADELLRLFHDEQGGGFFQPGSDAEALLVRPKELFDNAVPAGNSVAAELLLRLALLTGEERYERAGVSALQAVHGVLSRAPSMFGRALCAVDLYVSRAAEIAIVGNPADAATRELLDVAWKPYRPNVVIAAAAEGDADAARAVPLLAERTARDGAPTAYVCERFTCKQPVTDPVELAGQLS